VISDIGKEDIPLPFIPSRKGRGSKEKIIIKGKSP
jgi:hypothetical protein